jgi:DeoR family galactitol utilization operon repressor
MVEAGTTCAALCRYLAERRDVQLITNSSLAFEAAKSIRSLHITLAGGEFRPSAEAFVGPDTLRILSRYNARLAFVGTDGFSPRAGFTTNLAEDGEIISLMKEHAEQLIVLADASKAGQAGTVTYMPLSDADCLVSDLNMDAASREDLRNTLGLTSIDIEEMDAAFRYKFTR